MPKVPQTTHPTWTKMPASDHSDYQTVWRETNQVLALWVSALPRYRTLAIPVAIIIAARLLAVTIESALADHASETHP